MSSDPGGPAAPALAAWIELSVVADSEAIEAVGEILSRAAPGGVSIEPAFELVDEGLGARSDPTRPATVRAYLPAGEAADRALARVDAELGHLQAFGLRPIGRLRTRRVEVSDWAADWRRHFPVLRIGRRIVIRPSWRRHRTRPGEVVLALDPGMAFGTGLHPTTRLCLAGVEAWADAGLVEGRRVLDVGCGSGILGLAAARLGAASVLGVDTDPIAIEATIANARRNRLARRVRATAGSLPAPGEPYDLVIANLIASLVVSLAVQLHAAVRPGDGRPGSGGRLLAGGIFMDREPEARRALAAAGLHLVGRRAEGEWVALEAERIG